jgi:nesprin-1
MDLDQNLVSQFSSLTNQHNETLSRIMDRHAQVKSRISAWDRYRSDQTTLLSWLKDMENARYKLNLHYVHIQQVSKVLARIQSLLEKIPEGLNQLDNLKEQQLELLEFSDRTLAASIQMEHAAINQRIINLQAGLETWRDFLQRVLNLHTNFEQQAVQIQATLNDVKAVTCRPCPTSNNEIIATIENLRVIISFLDKTSTDAQNSFESTFAENFFKISKKYVNFCIFLKIAIKRLLL